MSILSITACRQDSEVKSADQLSSDASARVAACTVRFNSVGSYALGFTPKLAPVSSGEAVLGSGSDCDYFVGFNANSYTKVVAALLDDEPVRNAINSLIKSPSPLGFGGRLAKATRSGDSRQYVIIGADRANASLGGFARFRGTTVRALLGKHLRMAN